MMFVQLEWTRYTPDELNTGRTSKTRSSVLAAFRLSIILVFLFSGCATGERFGLNGDSGDDPAPDDLGGCQEDADCWDGDPGTSDVCSPDGTCIFPQVDQPDTDSDTSTGGDDLCDFDLGVDEDTLLQLHLGQAMAQISYAAPLSMATVVKIHVREPRRLWLNPFIDGRDDVMMVLLKDCANAAVNRIAWGTKIYTEELPEGDYYLAIFTEEEQEISVDTRFLMPTYCDGAPKLKLGSTYGLLDGLADDFSGSCVEHDALEHRGDRIFSFEVPQSVIRDVQIDVFAPESTPVFHLYLTRGCGDGVAVEIDCQDELNVPNAGHLGSEPRVSVHGDKLKSGIYYVVVDTVDDQNWETDEFELFFTMESIQVLTD